MVLVWAVVIASILGSLHCVGMCGPLAFWASGSAEPHSASRVSLATGLYHLGRLIPYVGLGMLAGGLGSLVDLGANAFGWQLVAARFAGLLMVGVGVLQIYRLFAQRRKRPSSSQGEVAIVGEVAFVGEVATSQQKPDWITATLIRLRPLVFTLSLELRALLVGMLTAFLPCGWLYLFALFASGTANVWSGGMVMAAFWVGTVPALTVLVAGMHKLSNQMRFVLPVAAAVMLILAGSFTFTGRGFAGVHSIEQMSTSLEKLAVPAAGNASEVSSDPATMNGIDVHTATDSVQLPCCSKKPSTP